MALPTAKDLFSICSLTKPIDDPKQYFQMYDEIVSIIKLIDYFKLNEKIGMLLYDSFSNSYMKLGEKVGKAWGEGKKFM